MSELETKKEQEPKRAEHTLTNTTSRGMVLEQRQGGGIKSIPLVDLLPPEAVGKTGTFKVIIEFEEKV